MDKEQSQGYLERWRKQQKINSAARLFNGPKREIRKFFTPEKYVCGFVPKFEGKLFRIVEKTKKMEYNKMDYVGTFGVNTHPLYVYYSIKGIYISYKINKSTHRPLFEFYPKTKYFVQHYSEEQKQIEIGSIVMTTGNAFAQTKLGMVFSDEKPLKFLEIIGPNNVGYFDMNFLSKP